jgi:hypothetical protein
MRDRHYGETKYKEQVEINEGIQKRRNEEKKSKTCGLQACSTN